MEPGGHAAADAEHGWERKRGPMKSHGLHLRANTYTSKQVSGTKNDRACRWPIDFTAGGVASFKITSSQTVGVILAAERASQRT